MKKEFSAKETLEKKEQVVQEDTSTDRGRSTRRKVYERARQVQIPQHISDLFAKRGYALKPIRWAIRGEEDYRNLSRRVREGYEFVTKDELPEDYLTFLRIRDTDAVKGMITMDDLCLMKIDIDLQQSRKEYYENITKEEMDAANLHVTLGKKGYITKDTKTRITHKEPSFQD